jgi:hypothetical protein
MALQIQSKASMREDAIPRSLPLLKLMETLERSQVNEIHGFLMAQTLKPTL